MGVDINAESQTKRFESGVDWGYKEISLQLPDADEEKLINAGIDADPDTFEVSDAQFKKMCSFV